MTSPWLFRPATVARGPRRQRADQVHRRPRQRAGRRRHRHRPVRLDAVSEHRRRATGRRSRRCGASRRSARRACATGGATLDAPSRRITSPSARRRWRCAWTANARNAQALAEFLRGHPSVARRPFPRLAVASAARARAGVVSRARRAAVVRAGARARRRRVSSIGLRVVVLSSNLGDNRTLAIPVAQTIFWEMGAARRAEMGIADRSSASRSASRIATT